jgi:predicted transcriptional regulator
VKKVMGIVKVNSVVNDSPENLWKNYNSVGGINKKKFMEYFQGKNNAFGIMLGGVRNLAEPHIPENFGINGSIPQNFKYLSEKIFKKVEKMSIV